VNDELIKTKVELQVLMENKKESAKA